MSACRERIARSMSLLSLRRAVLQLIKSFEHPLTLCFQFLDELPEALGGGQLSVFENIITDGCIV